MKRPSRAVGPKKKKASVRPVSARPLKSALDSLRPHLAGCRALDLFCGLGRFGLGALKEGAAAVIFVDADPRNLDSIKGPAQRHSGAATLACVDVFRFLDRTAETFDVIFADPPFPMWTDAFDRKLFVTVAPRLEKGGIFLVKHPAGVVPSGTGFARWKTSVFGESGLSYFTHGNDR